MTASQRVYLSELLRPFVQFLEREGVTDLYVNRPGEIWIESLGGDIGRADVPALSEQHLMRFARQVAALNDQGISREHPLLSASLPDGSRIQVIAPPATRGSPALAIRRHVVASLQLEDYDNREAGPKPSSDDARAVVQQLIADGDWTGALRIATRARLNILIAGGTSTGKTTFLNTLLREISAHERLIFIEDTPEIQITHDNAIGLIAVRGELGEASVSAVDLVTASLRMRPDRLILGELRGDEAFAFLRAVNTGHPGSMTTIHADSPDGAIEQLVLLVLQSGTRLTRSDVRDYIQTTVDLIVQLGRAGGRRKIEELSYLRRKSS